MLHVALRVRGRTLLLLTLCPEPAEPERPREPDERGPGAFLPAGEVSPSAPDQWCGFGFRPR